MPYSVVICLFAFSLPFFPHGLFQFGKLHQKVQPAILYFLLCISAILACCFWSKCSDDLIIWFLLISDGSHKGSTGAASSATEELDVLMASLSTFKVGRQILCFCRTPLPSSGRCNQRPTFVLKRTWKVFICFCRLFIVMEKREWRLTSPREFLQLFSVTFWCI